MLGAFQPGQKSLPASVLNKMRTLGQATSVGIPGAGGRTHTLVTPQGTIELPPYPKTRIAKITAIVEFGQSGSGNSGSSCTGVGYEWVPQRPASCGTWENADDVSFESGSHDYMTAFEANGATDVPVGTIVLLWEGFNNLTSSREWIFWTGGGTGATAVVKVLGSVGADLQSGCASGVDLLQCPMRMQYGAIQTYDQSCDTWKNGRCVLVADLEGRNLHIGKRYLAMRIDSLAKNLQATILPVDSPCQPSDYVIGTSFYVTTLTNPTLKLLILSEIGQLCTSQSGSGSSTTQTFTDNPNLTLYTAEIQRWNPETCQEEIADATIYAAEMHGCTLDIGVHYAGFYETVVPSFSSGNHTESCIALYLVDHVKATPRGVADIRLGTNGDIQVYVWQAAGRCGEVEAVLSHTIASCCQSGAGSGSGTAPGEPCCDGRTIGPMYATVPGAGTCAMTLQVFSDGVYWWYCHLALSCGKTIHLRWINCVAQYCCDNVHWTALSSAVGEADTCSPFFISRKWDGANMDSSAGCDPTPVCGTINGIVFSE